MKNNPRLTHVKGPRDSDENIIDAEFEEIDDPNPSKAPNQQSERPTSLREWFRQQKWPIKFFLVGGGAIFALNLMGSVFGSSSPTSTEASQAAAPSTPEPDSSPTAEARQEEDQALPESVEAEGYCHMGACSWINIKRRTVSEQDKGTELVALRILGGTSPDTGSADRDRDKIVWNNAPREVYAFCSFELPAVMNDVNGKWHVDVLDFTDVVPGILEDNATLYSYACHGNLTTWRRPDFAKYFGYKSPRYNTFEIGKPEDITSM